MPLKSIPVQLDPNEIRHDEGRIESLWTPGETIGKFQEWTRFWIRQDAETVKREAASTLLVYVRPCVRDNQWAMNPLKKKYGGETYIELYAPLENDGKLVELLSITPSNLDAVLVWTEEDGYELDQASVETLFPDNIKIEKRGTAWVVYEKMLTREERAHQQLQDQKLAEQQKRDSRFITTEDIVTGDEIRTLPFTNVDSVTGDKIYHQLEAAHEKRDQGNQNIREAVHLCDKTGPVKGFLDLFTKEEQERLHKADKALVEKVHMEFIRHCLAGDINVILEKADRAFEAHIEPYVEKIKNPDARASVQKTIQTWNNNKQNPTRNFYYRSNRYHTAEAPNPGHDFPVPTFKKHPDFFSMMKLDASIASDNAGAGYDPGHGVLMLRLTDRDLNFVEALSAMHEVTHKNQHSAAIGKSNRHAENHSRYTGPIFDNKSDTDENMNGILEEECEAWSNMLELLFARIGFGSHNAETVAQALGLDETDNALLHNVYDLLILSKAYFDGGGRKDSTYPPAFVDAIKEKYLRLNCNLFVLDAEGFPVPYQANT